MKDTKGVPLYSEIIVRKKRVSLNTFGSPFNWGSLFILKS